MSDLNYNRDRVLRYSFNRMTWSVVAVVAAIIFVVGVCLYSSYSDPDKSSAVRDSPPPQAEMNH
jgi:hypothetical protein